MTSHMKTKAAFALLGLAVLGGCVQVSAPEKPIQISLDINIRQEVIVRLTEDVEALRREQPGVF